MGERRTNTGPLCLERDKGDTGPRSKKPKLCSSSAFKPLGALSLLGPTLVEGGPGCDLVTGHRFVITLSEMTWGHALIRLTC